MQIYAQNICIYQKNVVPLQPKMLEKRTKYHQNTLEKRTKRSQNMLEKRTKQRTLYA